MNGNDPSTSPRLVLLNFYSTIMRLLSGVMVGLILLFLLPVITPYLENAHEFRYIRSALTVQAALEQGVRSSFPTKIAGKDMSRWLAILAFFILSSSFSKSGEKFYGKAQYLRYKLSMEEWKEYMHLSDNAIVLSPLNRKLEQIKNAKSRDREQLLKEFAETKKRLDAMGRDLAFLSVDVVDSTGMKSGEERAAIEHDFKEYRRLVERALAASGCLKATWTPDGVMSCFTTVDAAVRSAQEVIDALEDFNHHVKTIRRNFSVRCGVNFGFVYFDDSMPLEDISDRVIDVAAHIQKKAKPNSICVAKQAIEPLNGREGFEPAGTMVDGYELYEWRKRAAAY
ncbi:MAG: guanylate cyclase [Ignavibacteriae bacterium]|nr:guanylate cyclase [Ignavibacteria bacterium]MBI3365395.1 guanylate cyclase [Ignavibacteriota bacterium]